MNRAATALAGVAIAMMSGAALGQTVPARMIFFNRSWTLPPAESTWSGSAWSLPTVLPAMTDGTRCLLVYTKDSDRVFARVFDGTNWSSEVSGPALRSGNKVKVVQSTPGSSGKEIFVPASNENIDLWAMGWDGSTLGTGALVQDPLAGMWAMSRLA